MKSNRRKKCTAKSNVGLTCFALKSAKPAGIVSLHLLGSGYTHYSAPKNTPGTLGGETKSPDYWYPPCLENTPAKYAFTYMCFIEYELGEVHTQGYSNSSNCSSNSNIRTFLEVFEVPRAALLKCSIVSCRLGILFLGSSFVSFCTREASIASITSRSWSSKSMSQSSMSQTGKRF